MSAADEFRAEARELIIRIGNARACIHIDEKTGDAVTHDEGMRKGQICVQDPAYEAAMAELDDLADATEERINVLTDAVEQLHRTAHGIDHGLYICPHEPCRGLHQYLPNAHGVVVP